MIKMSVTGAKEIAKKLSRPLTAVMNSNFNSAAKILQRAVVREAPRKTGKYASTIKVKQSGSYNYTVYDGFPGQLLRGGVKPHIIVPRRKKALWWPGLGRPVLMVHHPGFKPIKYVDTAIASSKGEINVLTKQFGSAIVTELTK